MRIPLGLRAAAGAAVASSEVLESGTSNSDTVSFATTPATNTLILFFGQRAGTNIVLPTGYTLIAQRTGNNCRLLCAYKVSDGSETSVTSTSANVVGYAFVSVGSTLDVTGTLKASNGNAVSVTGITPSDPSLVFLFAAVNADASSCTQDGSGWTEVINTAVNESYSRDIAVWTKPGDGTATETVTVTFSNSPTVGVQFSVKP